MGDGEEPAFNFYWATHFGLLMDAHHPVDTEMHLEAYCDLKHVLKNIMYGTDETNRDHDVDSLPCWKRIPYVEAASCCEEILTWAVEYDDSPVHSKSEYSGPSQSYPTCVQAELVDIYNMLERQAYVETKRDVLEAVGTKLPTELYLMVSPRPEYTRKPWGA
jgi:hypothetical protein